MTSTEAIVFKLGRVIGGRDEVLNTPTAEIFAILDFQLAQEEAEVEREKERNWVQFLISLFSQPAHENESPERRMKRQQFIEMLQPKSKGRKETKRLEWGIPPEVLAEYGLDSEEGE